MNWDYQSDSIGYYRTLLTPDSPQWVGAWWLGFLIGGTAALLVAIPIIAYPRELPGSREFRETHISEVHQVRDGSHMAAIDPQFGKTVRDIPRSLLLLLKNPTFIFLCLSIACETAFNTGLSAFLPKILASQFSLSASTAATLVGMVTVPAGGIAIPLGGYIVKRLKLRCHGVLNFCIVFSILSYLLSFSFLMHCPTVPVAGVMVPYESSLTEEQLDPYKQQYYKPTESEPNNRSLLFRYNLTARCNADCGCDRKNYNPVCGADGVMYLSPCFAGCRSKNLIKSQGALQVYSGCSCVRANLSWGEESFVHTGRCSTDCKLMPVFFILLLLSIFVLFLYATPGIIAMLRCVPYSQRSLALGFQLTVTRVIGSIPGPVIFGVLIDKSCILWGGLHAERGSCYIYQNSDLSKYTITAVIIYKSLSLVFLLLAKILYRPLTGLPELPNVPEEGDKSDQPVEDLNEGSITGNHLSS